MRFVVDAQLPPALARYLVAQGHQAEHVFDLNMAGAEDSSIWNYAMTTGAAIVTKDEDFAIRISVAATGPSIVWLRIGNTSKRALLGWFSTLLPSIEAALTAGEKMVEVT
jgi:predicted nuclease of predicted toxin-antitoxin system